MQSNSLGAARMSSRLREVRTARGWSQERLVREIERYAHQCMAVVASTASLHVYISEWENGKRTISARYAAILRPVLGVTSSELLGNPASSALPASADGYEDLVSRIESARSIGVDVVNSLMDQTELLRTFDRQRGRPVWSTRWRVTWRHWRKPLPLQFSPTLDSR